jgi:phenylpyruvate tautomerase PptA (4-oxalocrotonate tautomerase family)
MNTATVIVYGTAPSIRLNQLEAIVRIRVAENEELNLDPANVIVHFPASNCETKNISCIVLIHTMEELSANTKDKIKSKITLCLHNFLTPKPRFIQIFVREVESVDYHFES